MAAAALVGKQLSMYKSPFVNVCHLIDLGLQQGTVQHKRSTDVANTVVISYCDNIKSHDDP